jgi:serine protease
MRGVRGIPAAICGFVIATVAGASPALSAPPGQQAPTADQAIVLVSTPDLPGGRSDAARRRWQRLRERSLELLAGVVGRNDLRVESLVPEIGMLVVDLGDGGLPSLRRELEGEPKVKSVHPDLPVELRFQPNDPAFDQLDIHAPNRDYAQWNLLRSGATRAWDLSRGTGAEVAVIDTGTYGGHPDLAPRIVASAAFGTSSPTTDPVGHGTHTAGLACAAANNDYGIASLGFECSIFVEKIGNSCSNVNSAITAAANRFSDVISISLGGCPRGSMNSALNYAVSRGSVLVVAGANDPLADPSCDTIPDPNNCVEPAEWVQPPGTGPTVGFDRGLVVTAAKYDGTRAGFAQMTTGVSVAAYGAASNSSSGEQHGILSTFPASGTDFESGRTTVNGDNRFGYLVGTSMATPQVSGVAALMRAVKPSMPASKVVHLIKATASGCGTYGGGIGWGVIRADEAVEAALDKDVDPPNSRVRSAKRARHAGGADAGAPGGRVINLRIKRGDAAGSNCAEQLPVSGMKKVVLFASANGGIYHRIAKTTKKRIRFQAKPRRRYRFYSVAVDQEGNREPVPVRADAKL